MAALGFDLASTLVALDDATNEGKITSSAAKNITSWLTETRYAAYAGQVAAHIDQGKWKILDDVFWTIIPFGTGGRRGRMYPIGSNAINDRTIGESAQGLADYTKQHANSPLACGIAFDSRHQSPEFAKLCAGIMVAAGFKVYFLAEIRSTPELSFLVRYKKCSCGIMVTASHNPPSDNAVKAYWSTGGQILPPHDKGVIDCVMNVDQIQVADFDEAVADGNIEYCQEEVDAAYLAEVRKQSFPGPREVKIIYSPLHGVGCTAVVPALAGAGFSEVDVFAPHANPDGDFPNVPGHVANPENPAVFDEIIEQGKRVGADLVLASDPDCDRLGCAAPLTNNPSENWSTFSGNQIGVLLTDYILRQKQRLGSLTSDHYIVKTLVTTEMARRVASSYGVKTYGDLLVGFKWIGGIMDDVGPDRFVFGTEESHGYLVGQYARDKDGAVASMLMAELAAECKSSGQSLHEKLDELYVQHGYHAERLVTQKMEGSEGMALMSRLMSKFKSDPPTTLAEVSVVAVRDYSAGTVNVPNGVCEPLEGPTGDLVIMDLELSGNYVAVRPSGTEPKVKFYMFTRAPVESQEDLKRAKQAMSQRLDHMQEDLERFALSTH